MRPGRCATTSPPAGATRGWWSASGRCTAPGTSSSRAPRVRPSTADRAVDQRDVRHRAERLPAVADDGLRRRLPHARSTRSAGQPQGPEQHPDRRRARPRLALRDRLGRGRPRRHPPRARHVRRFRRVRRRGRASSASRWRSTWPCSAAPDHPWVTTHPEMVHHPQRRHDRLRREPAEEVPGHLPAELRQRPQGHLRRGAPGRAGVDRPRRQDLPRRQPAHQAGGVLGVADRRRRRRPPRGDLAGRGVHPAGDDAHPRQGRLPAVLHLLRLAQPEVGAGEYVRSSPARRRPTCGRPSGPRPTTSSRPTCSTAARPPGSCAPRWPRRWCRPTASTPATSWSSTSPGPASRSRSTTRSTSTRTGDWADYEAGGPKEGQSIAPYLKLINQIRAAHPALHWLRNIAFHHVEDENVMAFSKRAAGRRP